MKKIVKLFGVFAFVVFVGLSLVTCQDTAGDSHDTMTAMEFAAGIRVGWNLGNAFDCLTNFAGYQSGTVSQLEQLWNNPVTTEANIQALKDAGFNLIRIPVTWTKVADPDNNYTIRTDWMQRVTQVVDWAIDRDMYVILNAHHDGNPSHSVLFTFDNSNVDQSLVRFARIWEQIAENFKYYGDKLIFEPLNEPIIYNTGGTSLNWTGTAEAYNIVNSHYKVFVETVRATGENNATRFFLFNTYAANSGLGAMNGLKLPDDPARDRHIVSYHAYVPGGFAMEGATDTWTNTGSQATAITYPMNNFYYEFVTSGVPVIIGEMGATDKANEAARAEWVEFYTKEAWNRKMRVVWWDNNSVYTGSGSNGEKFRLLNRGTNTIVYPLIMQGLLNGSRD